MKINPEENFIHLQACYQVKKKKKGLYIQYPKTVESFKLVVANFCRALSFFHSFMWTTLINNSAWSLIKDYVNHIKLTVIWVKRN